VTIAHDELDAALEPVRRALLDRAAADAAGTRASADDQAEALLARARAEADRLVAEARAQGAADGAVTLAASRARTRRQARAVVLAAQRRAYEELRRQARQEARRLVADLDLPSSAPGEGRRISWSPDALADEGVDALGAELEKLWAP
jgi:hypothetical protein